MKGHLLVIGSCLSAIAAGMAFNGGHILGALFYVGVAGVLGAMAITE